MTPMQHRAIRCINRNILECKDDGFREAVTNAWGINRNILECKGMYEI